MLRLPDGTFRYSPKDLNAFLEGDFAAWCERDYAETRGTGAAHATPDAADDESALVIRRGLEHEATYLATLRQQEPGIVEIPRSNDDAAFDATRAAIAAGAPIIYQGELRAGAWMGIADFLIRTRDPASPDSGHYEPRDTKLARSAKPYFILQLCAYAELLEAMHGTRPPQFGFIYGDGTAGSFRTADFWHYYIRIKRSFDLFQQNWSATGRPDPSFDRSWGRWDTTAQEILEATDDLILIANITRSQRVRLRAAGVTTVTALASRIAAVEKLAPAALSTLRLQAAMQLTTRATGTIAWELRATDPERPRAGLAQLPPPSPNDIFFDIEGFPYALDGLEYLLGVTIVDTGTPVFRDWWAHDEAAERRSFEHFVDWAYARWQEDPTLHIYHYAAYESTALNRLGSKYGSREDQVDEFLRHGVLVDLYTVVRQGLVVGTPSYSLKEIEHLYMAPRTESVTSAGSSVVEYQRWIDQGEPGDPAASPILAGIRDYNKVDCESTVGLRDWLLDRQRDAGVAWVPHDSNGADPATPPLPTPAIVLAEQLLERAEKLTVGPEEHRITRLVAWLLEYHRREEKPFWHKYFKRMEITDDELYDDMDCLAGLERTGTPVRTIKRSSGYEYRFDPDQDTKLDAGSKCVQVGGEQMKCSIEWIDCDTGIVELSVGPGKTLPDRLSIIPGETIPTKGLRDGILDYATRWATDPRTQPALADLLTRHPPRLIDAQAPFVFDEAGDVTAQSIDAARRLDHSTLCIQGPPGTGKTTAAAQIIQALVADGKRVGVVASSHQVILNLLAKIAEVGGQHALLFKAGGEPDHPLIASARITHIAQNNAVAAALPQGPLVIGGTAWLFARPDMTGVLDYLFVEEAGQFALANVVAVANAAANLILLGDQMQLAQPTQAVHPGESGESALEYLLHGHATVPPGLGIFLGRSYRMHPDVCRVVSEAYYEDRLKSVAETATNRIIGAAATSIGLEAGVRFVAVEHDGCTQGSDEEVDAIEAIVAELLTCQVTVKGSDARPMTVGDILVVAPFNMQVRALKSRLSSRFGAGARVGTVDKFQGQEAPVVIVSMCASTLEDAPRGPGFLLSPNRLNVAISRAQALAIVVGSAKLGDVRVRSVGEMRLVSGWCRVEGCGG
jgi:uncharacterized protein